MIWIHVEELETPTTIWGTVLPLSASAEQLLPHPTTLLSSLPTPPPTISTTPFLGHHFSGNSHLVLVPDSKPSDSAFSNGAGACSAITRSTARLSSKQNDWDRGLSWACVVTGNALPRDTGLDLRTMLRLARTRDCRYVSQRCLASVGDSGVSVSPFSAGTVPELFPDSGFFSTMRPASMLIKPSSLSGLPSKSRAVRKNPSYEVSVKCWVQNRSSLKWQRQTYLKTRAKTDTTFLTKFHIIFLPFYGKKT